MIVMSRRKLYSFGAFGIMIFLTWFFSAPTDRKDDFSELVKISMRDIGDRLLTATHDSTSLVLPVVALDDSKYELSFQNTLSFEPSTLVTIVEGAFIKAKLPQEYIVEVVQCTSEEVAYSYQMTTEEQTTIIPCSGRDLPESCYKIVVKFSRKSGSFFSNQAFLYLPIFLVFLLLESRLNKGRQGIKERKSNEEYTSIGSFLFYPNENLLIRGGLDIGLSKKECELLIIFVESSNQIVRRDELMKKVWEDNGVIVGRSLDTYISRLRKKLQEDDSIKLSNVHGVGYRLELSS